MYFAGGEYFYPQLQASGNAMVTGIKMQNKPVNLHGGFPADLSGTAVPELSYPTDTPTILNGDRNGNGKADEGDMRNLISYRQPRRKPLFFRIRSSALSRDSLLKTLIMPEQKEPNSGPSMST